jgi:hypothetical protein
LAFASHPCVLLLGGYADGCGSKRGSDIPWE